MTGGRVKWFDPVKGFGFIVAEGSGGDILLHVVNHGTYHRGHVASMMHTHGVMAPTTDFPVFLKSRTSV